MSTPLLLQQFTFDGTLSGAGTLALAATTSDSVASYTTGPVAGTQALVLSSTRRINIPYHVSLDFTGLAQFSMGGWYYITALSSSNRWFGNGLWGYPTLSSQRGVDLYSTNYTSAIDITLAATTNPDPAIKLNAWTHMWLIATDEKMYVYLNGVIVHTTSIGNSAYNTLNRGWQLNGNPLVTGSNFTCRIADFRFYQNIYNPGPLMGFPLSATVTIANISHPGANNGTITLTPSYGNSIYTYAWTKNGSAFSSSQNLSLLSNGLYVCTITSGNESTTVSATVIELTPLFGSSVAVKGTNVVIGSKGWSQKNDPVIGASGATYVYSKTGSSWTRQLQLAPHSVYSTAKGALGTSVSLNSTHIVAGGNELTTSTVYKGAAVFKQVWFNVAGVITHAAYFGLKNASITAPVVAFGTPPHTYKWSDNALVTTPARSGIGAGTYVQTISDSTLPTAQTMTYTYVITQPAAITSTITTVNCSNFDVSDGTITSTSASGGTGALTHKWSTGATTTSITNIGAGDYTLTITDSLGYYTARDFTVTEPQLTASSSNSTPISTTVSWTTSKALDASTYQVDYVSPNGKPTTFVTTNSATTTIIGLIPSTTYTIKIYKMTNRSQNIRKPLATITATTTADTPANYTKASYLMPVAAGGTPTYDLSRISKGIPINIDFNSTFSNTDTIRLPARIKQTDPANLVRRNTRLKLKKLKSVILPFEATAGAGQEVELEEEENNFIIPIIYNESSDSITINGSTYTTNSSFRYGGKYRVRL